MEYRQLGHSGLKVPVLSFGTATFGGGSDFLKKWGSTQLKEAQRMIGLCMDAGVNFFDTANIYSFGMAEDILGQALEGKRNECLISTKATFPMSDPEQENNYGSSRFHLIKACEDSLKRLRTDHIDLYYMHGFDNNTPVEETLRALDDLVQSGKIRYIGCSNFSGWHLMKSLSASEKYGWSKYIAHQVYYSLVNRELEWELMPLGLDQGVGTVVWSPLAGGRLSGKIKRGQPIPPESRIAQGGGLGPNVPDELFFDIVDVLEEIAAETGKSPAQVSLNWLLNQPTVTSLVIGARTEEQLKQNLEASGWNLTKGQVERLNRVSEVPAIYPYWHQARYPMLRKKP